MFLLMGISGKVKDCGRAEHGVCPVCGKAGTLHITHKYMTPHIFFIPTFRWGSSYLATCASCTSLMELNKEKGKAVARGDEVWLSPEDLRVLQNNAVPLCSHCGARISPGSVYCSQCGGRV